MSEKRGVFIPISNEEDLKDLETKLSELGVQHSIVGSSSNKVKLLPRLPNGQVNNVFIANGNTYTILSPEQGIGIERYTQLSKFLIPLWYGKRSFKEIQNYWNDAIGESFRTSTLQECQNLFMNKGKLFIDSLTDISKERYDIAMYICALFIVREDEDLRFFRIDEAERKINDWVEEGFSPYDFFGIASSLSSQFKNELEARKALEKDREGLLIGLGNTE